MIIRSLILLIIISFSHASYAKCDRPDRSHVNESVVHCTYHQEDIFRCYREKTGCYKNEQRRKECFFCGCPIEEHTKVKNKQAQVKAKKYNKRS